MKHLNPFKSSLKIKPFQGISREFSKAHLMPNDDDMPFFKNHLKNVCKKANQKLTARVRITNFTSPFQSKNSLVSFINFHYSY